MKYQLVIQFSEELFESIDEIGCFEDKLDHALIDAEVDGHDIGSGEINIFIHTNSPGNTFDIVKKILKEEAFSLEYLKIAYREIGSEYYITMWPENFEGFSVS